MIDVDIAQLELLTDTVMRSASDAEELLARLRAAAAEMQADDALALYEQAVVAQESVTLAVAALGRGADCLRSLGAALLPAADMYLENERENKEMLERTTADMGRLRTDFAATLENGHVPQAAHTDAVSCQNKAQQLVTDSLVEMQAVNIAAVAKAARGEYTVKTVVTVPTAL